MARKVRDYTVAEVEIIEVDYTALDLADEASWEDLPGITDTLDEEDTHQPIFGGECRIANGVHAYVNWWLDADQAALDSDNL